MIDKIFINDLVFDAIIGVLEHERTDPQPIRIDLQLAVDTRRAARSRDLADTVDYAGLAEEIKQLTLAAKPLLIETLVEDIAAHILNNPMVQAATVRVTKPKALRGSAIPAIEIYRTR